MATMDPMGTDVISLLVNDHREVERMFHQLENTARGDGETHRTLSTQVIAELVRHSVAEEQYLYPAVRKVVPDGDEIADHEIEEHSEAERTMKHLESADPEKDADDYQKYLHTLISEIRHHVEEEEKNLFPKLSAHADTAELEDLGAKLSRAKDRAPTHPHPGAPDKPPMNKLLDPGAGLVDRVRDALAGHGA